MHKLGFYPTSYYNIAGYIIKINKNKQPYYLLAPDTLDSFKIDESDYVDYEVNLISDIPSDTLSKQLIVKDQEVILDYGTLESRTYLKTDFDLSKWFVYSSTSFSEAFECFEEMGHLFAWSMPSKDALVIHGVLMEWQGKGIIITASSGTGKTTHARLWRDLENAFIINGDRVLIKKENNKWYGYGIPWSGSSGECINRKVPLDSIVFLNRGEENYTKVLSPLEAFNNFLPRVIAPKWHETYRNKAIDLSIECLEEIPLIDLYCLPNKESVEILKKVIETF